MSRDVKCRAGCQETETAAHVIQNCHRTHGGRVLRHNAVCHVLAAGLRRAGWSVEEPVIPTREGNRKPDMVCYKEDTATVIDTQIVSADSSLNDSHQRKRNYYAKNPDEPPKLVEKLGIDLKNLTFTSCTVSWRGVWATKLQEDLLRMGLTKNLLSSITTRVLQGSHTNWSRFNRMTNMKHRSPTREGIG
ncbi:hypothetical protein R5R35_008165 [Gryllus longicercus]|uniref:Rhodanese domain-containing protein n=1 Tax=Gryllus longicercus TaxID=2509291 RepID=A0AAN9VX58_9ORTH